MSFGVHYTFANVKSNLKRLALHISFLGNYRCCFSAFLHSICPLWHQFVYTTYDVSGSSSSSDNRLTVFLSFCICGGISVPSLPFAMLWFLTDFFSYSVRMINHSDSLSVQTFSAYYFHRKRLLRLAMSCVKADPLSNKGLHLYVFTLSRKVFFLCLLLLQSWPGSWISLWKRSTSSEWRTPIPWQHRASRS